MSDEKQPSPLHAALRRRIAMALGIDDAAVDALPFLPVIIAANLDATPGPRFDETTEGQTYEVLSFDLTNARDREPIYKTGIPIGQIWVDNLTAAASASLNVGAGRSLLSLVAVQQSYDFENEPTTQGLFLTNAAQAGATLKLGIALGRNLKIRPT